MGSLRRVVVAVDGSEESMRALEWALDNIRLCAPQEGDGDKGGTFIILHVQSPPTIYAGLNPGAIPFGGPAHVEVPAFTAAIEAHQTRITEAIMTHALDICSQRDVNVEQKVVVGEPKELICETTSKLQADLLVLGSHAYGALKRKTKSDKGVWAKLIGCLLSPCSQLWYHDQLYANAINHDLLILMLDVINIVYNLPTCLDASGKCQQLLP
ncbi:universal stress protein PHOS34 [Cryptomeria japonica]|uniref:universal stress protein PHOS34 n=1 Tax=Cryptomeria japonica TaxID=3369 RepID=UPI0027DA76A6|nr:universal stress protein PHOS34 [Cryptomeria japonica]